MSIQTEPTPATRRQRWMLYILTKDKGWYDVPISMAEAGEEIRKLKDKQAMDRCRQIIGFEAIWDEAIKAGEDALAKCTPIPMVVQQHSNQMDDTSLVEKEWYVADGCCGFAWVNIKPATSAFARWLLNDHSKDVRTDSYYGGVTYWVWQGNQSMAKKEAFAGAMARVLCSHGISASSMSRID